MTGRERLIMDYDWKFKLASGELLRLQTGWLNTGNCKGAGMGAAYDDSSWRRLDLPHDFVVEREFNPENGATEDPNQFTTSMNGSKPGGIAWYRKHFHIPAEDEGRRILIYFDGVFRDSRVFLNDFYVGGNLSGYTSFYFDVSDFINYGGENVLAVRVDATQHEGWWYEGGGIYRHVWLEKTDPLHIAPWGSFVSALVDLPRKRARLHIEISMLNQKSEVARCQLISQVIDPSGQEVAMDEAHVFIKANASAVEKQDIQIQNPRLWSLDEPYLYEVKTTVMLDGQKVDEVTTTTGIRTIRFDANKGFLLNNQPVKFKGVCCHQDHAGVGIAVPDRIQEYRIKKLKEMGCNAYRTSHHPPGPELLDACDRLGMLVMDENRHLSSSSEELAQLESLVRRDRNHPSVVLWSLGNEEVVIHWTPPSARITRTLQDRIHQLDPTRPATLAICYWNPVTGREEPLENSPLPTGELDVMGFNYAPSVWEAYHAFRPEQPLVVSEATTSLRTRGDYFSDPIRCHIAWDSAGAQPYHEEQWDLVARHPYLSGIFLWTGFDYRGEPTPHNWPAINSHFGLMDTCGFPKDNYYYYQAWWREQPLVHIFPHWNWPERMGQPLKVYCYSNCDEVELFLNGKSLGRKAMMTKRHLEWENVIYEPGALEATGYRNGAETVIDRVETTGAPYSISLEAACSSMHAGRRDAAVINVAVLDLQKRVVPVADNEILFAVQGEGTILGVGNGNPSSHEPDKASLRRAFNGLCQVLVLAGDGPGQLVLSASSPGLHGASLVVDVV
jgi:beta-galactosidase